jgi:hypothetical protein
MKEKDEDHEPRESHATEAPDEDDIPRRWSAGDGCPGCKRGLFIVLEGPDGCSGSSGRHGRDVSGVSSRFFDHDQDTRR